MRVLLVPSPSPRVAGTDEAPSSLTRDRFQPDIIVIDIRLKSTMPRGDNVCIDC
jgi:hypothetical protein